MTRTCGWSLLLAAMAACGSGGGGGGSGGAGIAAAQAIGASMEAAATVKAPWRCALPRSGSSGSSGATAAPAGWKRDADKLVADPARAKLTIGAVAQARGRAVDVRAKLRAANVDVVVAVGGMGTDAAESRAALTALLDPTWLVVALPGDTEQWPEHAAAIADLAAGGGAIVDGASVRIVDAGAAVLGTLPGEAFASRLGAGADGCVHDAADLGAALTAIADAASDRPRVLVTTPAPQGAAPGASDLTPGGLHGGDAALATAIAAAQIDLVLHAPVDGSPPAPGNVRTGTPVTLAAGSLDPIARRDADGRTLATGIVLATVDARGISWSFVPAP
ncbi:MAG TPA: hypothetical protein VM261_01835 [Kofleriaceae bacterium]|nr:hypothetical protein [Kofleriaceae bacterium]